MSGRLQGKVAFISGTGGGRGELPRYFLGKKERKS